MTPPSASTWAQLFLDTNSVVLLLTVGALPYLQISVFIFSFFFFKCTFRNAIRDTPVLLLNWKGFPHLSFLVVKIYKGGPRDTRGILSGVDFECIMIAFIHNWKCVSGNASLPSDNLGSGQILKHKHEVWAVGNMQIGSFVSHVSEWASWK